MQFPDRPVRRFMPGKTGSASPLGQLEEAVMHVVWSQAGELSVGEVHAALPADTPLAYNTVKTTMERLAEKGILTRSREGKAYLYQATISREALERRIISAALDRLVEQFPQAVASFFAQPDPAMSEERLALLAEAIARRRDSSD